MNGVVQRVLTIAILAVASFSCCFASAAQTSQSIVDYEISAQDLGSALIEFAVQSGMEILFVPEEIAGKSANEVTGRYDALSALQRLLDGTELPFRINDLDTILVGNQISVLNRPGADSAHQAQRPGPGDAMVSDSGQAPGQTGPRIDEVVVTGFRHSLRQSLKRKQRADHFVDSITAEDIGAFPDQNLAESMQRISGVAIDRRDGEGRFLSIRGLGPQFVQTTTNGRVVTSNVATADNDGISGSFHIQSRVIGFDQFQSGLLHAAMVYKSPRADHVAGGLGGIVELQTRRPLDIGRDEFALHVSQTQIDLSDDRAPGLFGLISNLSNDGRLGFMVSGEWDDRTTRTDIVNFSDYVSMPRTYTVGDDTVTGYHPSSYRGVLELNERERLNVSSALQWQATDDLTLTLDLLYTDNVIRSNEYWRVFGIATTLADGITSGATFTDNGTPVFRSISTNQSTLRLQHSDQDMALRSNTTGSNISWWITERLNLDVDVSISDTEFPVSYRDFLIRNTQTQVSYIRDARSAASPPTLASIDDLTDPSRYEVVKIGRQAHLPTDRIEDLRVDVDWQPDSSRVAAFSIGIRSARRERSDQSRFLASRAFLGESISLHGGTVRFPVSDFLDGIDVIFPADIATPNLASAQTAFFNRADEVLTGACFSTGPCSLAGFQAEPFNEDVDYSEDTLAMYAMVGFVGNLRGRTFTGNLGVRHVISDTTSLGLNQDPQGFDVSDPSRPQLIMSEPRLVMVHHDYREMLPSLNLKFELTDDLLLRSSIAKVMSRPSFQQVTPRQSGGGISRTIFRGNAKLDPVTAWQTDVSLEWYPDDDTFAGIGLFTKNVTGIIQAASGFVRFPDVIDPDTGLEAEIRTTEPRNGHGASLQGMELSYQQSFGNLGIIPDGFGVLFNLTYIDADSEFVNPLTGAPFGIPGLSEDTINLSLFYEHGPWGARVSYNRRDAFLDQISAGGGHPLFVDVYDQVDATLTYQPRESLTFSLEGFNLSDSNLRFTNRLGSGILDHFNSEQNAGPRFQLSLRWKP